MTILLILAALIVVVLAVPAIRRPLLSSPLFATYRRILPQMSETERAALEAGTVWWEGELFRGAPDWQRLLDYPAPRLSPAEQSFLDNEVAQACALVDDWQVSHELQDMSPETWQFIKDKGFLGMIIPRRYGGLEFSAFAHSQVVTKLSTRSSALAVSVMVPNSLGPAELLLHYGTEAQKDHYLPRLAKGLEIPAFALTSPWAGSDAAAIPDTGVVCRGQWQGREVVGMRISFDKRYITLAPVCTVFGLAFHLYDPDHLLGGAADIGITCALIPATHPGVEIGRRHFPLNAQFMNGPVRGKDVFVPLDFIIGGTAMAGQGWRMLMECLAAGRSISLPASNTGMAQLTARAVGGYARIRQQFGMPIGRFEGVEEALTRIGSFTYLMDATRKMTAGAVDLGEKPSVVSAIAKYHVTERARQVVNDGMDVIGGKGICLGPSNFLGRAYQQIPIGITVEGANILTRSLIIFGQGAIRCHPYVLAEMQAAQDDDARRGLEKFDTALWGHVAFSVRNGARTLWMGMTGSHFVPVPDGFGEETQRYVQQLTRFSSAFAFLSDVSMLVLGGGLKRREKLSARLGDILSQMYLMSATIKRFESEGRHAADAALMHWAIWDAMYKAQEAFDGVLANYPNRAVAWFLKRLIFPWGHPYVVPSDALGHAAARLLIDATPSRERLTAETFVAGSERDPVAAIELALKATLEAEPIDAKIRAADREGRFADNPAASVRDMSEVARAAGVIDDAELATLRRRNALRDRVIQVDDFPFDLGVAVRSSSADTAGSDPSGQQRQAA